MRWTTPLSVAFLVACAGGALGELAACATRPADVPPVAAPAAAPTCIGVKKWSPAEEQQLAQATATLPPSSPLIAALADYGRMRKAARAVCPAS